MAKILMKNVVGNFYVEVEKSPLYFPDFSNFFFKLYVNPNYKFQFYLPGTS